MSKPVLHASQSGRLVPRRLASRGQFHMRQSHRSITKKMRLSLPGGKWQYTHSSDNWQPRRHDASSRGFTLVLNINHVISMIKIKQLKLILDFLNYLPEDPVSTFSGTW